MIKSFVFFYLPLVCSAFSKLSIIDVPTVMKPVIVGSTKPLENFDPLNFSKDETKLSYLREAELKHGRIAMIASTSIPIIELFSKGPSIHNFDDLSNEQKLAITCTIFMSEFSTMIKGWKNPYTNPFELKETYQPGDFGFSLKNDLNSQESIELLNKELNNGRLAMISSVGMIAQELVTHKSIF